MKINLNIVLVVLDKKVEIGLCQTKTKIKKAITIYLVYFSTRVANFNEITFTILNPSNGGRGIILNTAKQIFIIENCIKKLIPNQ